jgi:NhaP-type Na+/H+ or K+/H+ antiporter
VKKFVPYITLIAFLAILSWGVHVLSIGNTERMEGAEFQVLVLGIALFVSYIVNRIAPDTAIPSFVWAIFAGVAMQQLLISFTGGTSGLQIAVELFAAIVLFAGGMEIPFKSFQKWFFPIASLSILGVTVSAIGFSIALYFLAAYVGTLEVILLPSIVILGATLSSTDPTAIIPTLKSLTFKRVFIKQIAIAESALTDISGSILTRFLLLAFVSVPLTAGTTVFSFFSPLINKSAYDALGLQIISGLLIGYIGYRVLVQFYRDEGEGDPALLLAIPIITFVVGDFLGGAGFLAAFVSGLLVDITGEARKASHFYENFLDHLVKPFVFIILGALVPFAILLDLAPLGIIAALLFMFVIRPLVVFVSLIPWLVQKVFTWGDLLFLSFVRETGIIAAVLLIIASSSGAIQSDFIIAIGMWVILLTLIIEPPLTPYVARITGVTK